MKNFTVFRKISELLTLIPYKQKVIFFFLIIFVIFSSIFEVFSVYLIIPTYKTLVDNLPISESIPFVERIIEPSFSSLMQEKLVILIIFAIVFVLGNILKSLIIWCSSIQTANISVFLFSSAYSKILFKPYETLSNSNLSRFSSYFNTTNAFFVKILEQSILLVGYLITSIILITTLLFVEPEVTIFGLVFISVPYLIFSKLTGPFLQRISNQQGILHEEINRYIQEGFKSLKTIKHFRVFNYYIKTFEKKENKLRRISAIAEFINTSPKLLLEASGICLITLLFGISYFVDSINIQYVYIITLGFAAQKILPTIQQIFRIWAFIMANSYSVNDLHSFFFSKEEILRKKAKFDNDAIIFKNISYKYPKDDKYILSKFNLKINFPNSLSITGSSGCGKTTLVDLLTGLLIPTQGSIIYPKELKQIKYIGYVPQEVPIVNGTILDNIYLGDTAIKKDQRSLDKYLEIVELKKFINNLPAGLNTILGEQSINLSGGQKQRLGILRALVRRPKVLIMDESTNAIDEYSEDSIINKLIKEFSESLFIMISHNKRITKKFNMQITLNEKGELIETNFNS